MAQRRGSGDSAPVDLAMNQVLAAERDAREAVAACRQEAQRILEAAEERVLRISRRAERRVKVAHRVADAAVDRALLGLGREKGGRPAGPAGEVGDGSLDRAIDRLVDEILGPPA
jgi:hypothetical protein